MHLPLQVPTIALQEEAYAHMAMHPPVVHVVDKLPYLCKIIILFKIEAFDACQACGE